MRLVVVERLVGIAKCQPGTPSTGIGAMDFGRGNRERSAKCAARSASAARSHRGERHEDGLRDHSDVGLERLLVQRVAEREEAHRRVELLAPPPEELLPLEVDDEPREQLGRRDDHAAFVEERERIALGAAAPRLRLAALLQDRGVLRVDGRLGPAET